jgi:hypothetical protein
MVKKSEDSELRPGIPIHSTITWSGGNVGTSPLATHSFEAVVQWFHALDDQNPAATAEAMHASTAIGTSGRVMILARMP